MKKLKLFFAYLLMAVLSIGQVWADNAAVNDVLWSEDFGGFDADDNPSDHAATGWGSASITYSQGNVDTKAYNASLALGATPELLLKGSDTWVISGIPTGNATEMTLTYKSNNNKSSVTCTTTNVTCSGSLSGNSTDKYIGTYTIDNSTAKATTITLEFTCSGNTRLDNIQLVVTTAGTGGGGCEKNVTISKGTPSHGDFTLSKDGAQATCDAAVTVIVTPSPAEHYKTTGVTAPNSLSISDPDEDGKYTVTYAQNTNAASEINVNFTLKDQHTVTWNNHGITSTSQVYDGEKPVFPTPNPTSCDATSTTFIGWATTAWDGKLANTDGKTVYTSASAMPDVTGAVTYYAVYAKATASTPVPHDGPSFSRSSSSNTITSGYTFTSSASANTDNYQDQSTVGNTSFVGVYHTTSAIFSSTPNSILVTAKIGGGTGNRDLANPVCAQLLDDKGAPIGQAVEITSHITTNTGDDYVDIEIPTTGITSANGVRISHVKESGYNVRFYSFSLSYTTGGTTYSDYMTTCAACTHLVDAPELDGTIAVTHNTATINWKTLTNASSYDVTVIRNSDSESIFSGNVNALTKALTGLDPETKYDYSIMGVGDGSTYCTSGNGVLNGSFTTDAVPTAHLTLIDINGTHASSGDYVVGTPFNLPTTAATCAKTFVGWDANDECVTAPTYAKGASFTFANTTGVTLYAVYADVAPGTTTNIAYTDTETTTNMTGANDAALLGLDADEWSVVGAKGGNTNFPGLNKAKDIRLYYQSGDIGNTITITAPQAIESVALTFTGESYSNAWVKVGDELVTLSNGVYPINASSFVIGNANTTNVQVRISNIAVNFLGAQSNWATTCVDPLENPTFSLDPVVTPVEDKYTEAINVVITNNAGEGKIYYTTNNQTPTSASTEYAGAITLNTCGTKTIKAIVISDNNQSEVVSATYEMAIPIPSVSAEDPYTEAEAVAVIDGGCYNNEDVYVTGTVASNGAAWYPNSGTYTITLENGFKFYYFYEGENKQSFTDNYIAAGDVLVAKGKLEKSGNTYRLAQGCYLVSRTPAQKTPIDSDIDNPITVADALGYIDQAATYDLTNVYVKGVASEDPDNQGTFNIHDAGVENSLQIYKGVLSSALITAGVEVEENDTIIAVGELTKYYSTYEMAEGGEIVVVKKYIAPVVAVTGVEVDATATVKAGKTVQLTANVLPDNATNKNVTWTVESGDAYAEVSATGLVTGKAEGTAVIRATSVADDTKYGECTVTVNPGTPANTDILTAEEIGVSGPYDNWSGKNTFGTTSVYAGNSTTGTGTNAGAIQLRYHATDETKQAGIVLTGSNGMYLKNFAVTVKSGSNVLNVYAKNTAYSSKADLYSDDEDVCGKLIGTVSATGNLQLEDGVFYNDNYQYIGMRSAGGALYLEDITITWGAAYVPPTVYTVTFNSNGGSAVDAADVNEGDAVAKPADPTKDDYNFVEWQLNGVAYDFTAAVTANITLDAVWEPVTPPTPTYETVRTGLTAGNYYTICYPKAMTDVQGATLWSFVGKDADFAYIVQETATTIEAGKPYILYATASTVTAVIGTDDASAGVNGAIHGTLDPMDQTALNTAATDAGKDLYLVIGNQLRKATGYANDGITPLTGNSLPANRAFVVLGDIPNAPAHMPAHVRSMPLHKDTATGMDELNASETPVKVMIDGQLFILRGEKLYDATGRLVK